MGAIEREGDVGVPRQPAPRLPTQLGVDHDGHDPPAEGAEHDGDEHRGRRGRDQDAIPDVEPGREQGAGRPALHDLGLRCGEPIDVHGGQPARVADPVTIRSVQHGSRKAILAALIANLCIAVAKFVGFLITGAASMLAESVHSMADSGNQALLILGGSRAARKATPEHPFGYGRERYFWAFVVALVLFSFGGLFASYEGFQKLSDPHELETPLVAVGILVFAIAVESWSLRTAVREARLVKGDESWWSFIRHSKSPELPVVLLEDLGAEIGLFLALIGVGLAELTGNARWDALGSLAIGVLLIVIAVLLAVEMKSLLVGEGASPKDAEAIRAAIEGAPDVKRLIHLRTEHLGPEELIVGAKVELDAGLSFVEVAAAVNAIESHVRGAVPAARVMYVEPDVYSADTAAEVREVAAPPAH